RRASCARSGGQGGPRRYQRIRGASQGGFSWCGLLASLLILERPDPGVLLSKDVLERVALMLWGVHWFELSSVSPHTSRQTRSNRMRGDCLALPGDVPNSLNWRR